MTTASLPQPFQPRVLADALVGRRSLAIDAALVTAGALFTGLLAQVVIPLWPVPITGQTLAVLLVGATLGAARGAISMLLYLVLGVVGVPLFAEWSSGTGALFGASGGYIVGFVLAAALTGWLAERAWDRKIVGAGIAMLVGTVATFAIGLPWLAIATGADFAQTMEWGLLPFIPGGIVKALIAAALLPLLWRGVRAIDARRDA